MNSPKIEPMSVEALDLSKLSYNEIQAGIAAGSLPANAVELAIGAVLPELKQLSDEGLLNSLSANALKPPKENL